jgi:GAF domain-containing protein
MLPMVCSDDLWGLVEVYDNRRDGFATDDVDVARRVVDRACAALERLAAN